MTKTHIYLAQELKLPMEVLTQKTSLMGGNGSGKSYATSIILEQALEMGAWMIILDYAGIHYGLRLSADGKERSGFDIPIFGGLHGDLPLTPESGALIADLLCDRHISAILDVSQFETDGDFNQFVIDFGNQFYKRMKENRRAVTLVLEEAQEFLPQNPIEGTKQNPRRSDKMKLHVWQRMGKIGRQYGIGIVMVSPRPQEISKKVLNLTQTMLAFQMMGVSERKTMDEWCSYMALDVKLSKVLPTLEIGEAYVASPRTLKFNGMVKVNRKITFDASATPLFDAAEQSVALTPIDIKELRARMLELQKAESPFQKKPIEPLKIEERRDNTLVIQLRGENAKLTELAQERLDDLRTANQQLAEVSAKLEAVQALLRPDYEKLQTIFGEVSKVQISNGSYWEPFLKKLGGGEKRALETLIQHKRLSHHQLRLLASIGAQRTLTNIVTSLVGKGLVRREGKEIVLKEL